MEKNPFKNEQASIFFQNVKIDLRLPISKSLKRVAIKKALSALLMYLHPRRKLVAEPSGERWFA